MLFELLVEATRNQVVESRHFGAAVVSDYEGNILQSRGDIDNLVFPRSALKPLLAIQLVESGASEHYALNDAELSLACSSHQGQPIHQQLVSSWLERLGLSEENLACGEDLPADMESARHLLAAGQQGCRIHHNCSGKHVGFLTTALHMQLELGNYQLIEHPLQQLSIDILSDLANTDIRQYPMGIDGCGLPAPSMPLSKLGYMMARFAKPVDLAPQRSQAIWRLHQAIINEPLYIAGHGTMVSELNEVSKGVVLAKTGAEGIITASLPRQGLGVAVKIADGGSRARSVALLSILDDLGVLSDQMKLALQDHIKPKIINSRGQWVGEIRAV